MRLTAKQHLGDKRAPLSCEKMGLAAASRIWMSQVTTTRSVPGWPTSEAAQASAPPSSQPGGDRGRPTLSLGSLSSANIALQVPSDPALGL